MSSKARKRVNRYMRTGQRSLLACRDCEHRLPENRDGGWCYMWKDEPERCGQFTSTNPRALRGERINVDALISLMAGGMQP
jgi:hypothetical protein